MGIVFNAEGHVLLVEHVFHPQSPWGPPGGWIGRNENPAEAVRREIQEELELTVGVGLPILTEVTLGRHLDIAYLCYPKSEIGNLSYELLEYRWCDPHNLPTTKKFNRRAIERALEIVETTEQT